MPDLSGFPAFEIQFNKKGRLVDASEVTAVETHLGAPTAPTDLIVLSHGWNNDIARARALYQAFFQHLRGIIDSQAGDPLAGRRVSAVGILWPSKKFTDRELIPGGAASFGDTISDQDLERQIETLMGGFNADDADQRLAKARDLVIDLEDSPRARRAFVDLLRPLLADDDTSPDGELPPVHDSFLTLPGDKLLNRMGTPSEDEQAAGVGGGGAAGGAMDLDADDGAAATGAAAGLRDLGTGIRAGTRNFLNLLTYFKMKQRAGDIGLTPVNAVLQRFRQANPTVKLHLVGHSFGGRLVTAATAGPAGGPTLPIASLTLLQAAFSHHGLARNWDGNGNHGLFRRVLSEQRVTGPVLITHTVNDTAVGRAYPLASRIARQVASALGDANDKYGGIGRNGAQSTPEAKFETLLDVGGGYTFKAGAVHNLKADAFIANHGDVANDQTAYAVLEAIRTT